MNLYLISFLLTALGQPSAIRGVGPLAAALGFALFWKALFKAKNKFWTATVWFFAVQCVQLFWMTSMAYMGPLILLVYLFLSLGVACQFGFLSTLIRDLNWKSMLGLSGLWVLFEWARLFFLCGFTWNPVGLSLADSPWSIQFASLFGIFGLSFWVILTNLAALKAWREKTTPQLATWAILALTPYAFGLIQQAIVERKEARELRVALVQTALFPEQKERLPHAPAEYIPAPVQWERILALLDPAQPVDLIVLPEAALPMGARRGICPLPYARTLFSEDALPPVGAPFAVQTQGEWAVNNLFFGQALSNKFGAHVVIGMDDRDALGAYNAAFHFSPGQKELAPRYEKRVLVPMGEYVPLGGSEFVASILKQYFDVGGSFRPGNEAKIFEAQVPLGISICLEETFSSLVRESRQKGAKLLVNLTNDVWFPGSSLPRQHFDHGRVRAAENGIAMVRACNTGVTGWVDCFGQARDQLPVNEKTPDILYATISLREFSTLYSQIGDGTVCGLCAFLALYGVRRKKLL